MRVAITGGAGFIGANLARHLVERGSEVTVLDDLSTGSLENLDGLDVDFVEGSILDERDVARPVTDVDAIVHLAAVPSVPRSVKDPFTSHEANATGTLRVLRGRSPARMPTWSWPRRRRYTARIRRCRRSRRCGPCR